MNLTAAEARTVIQQQFNAVWGFPGSPLTPVAYDNVPFKAEELQEPWVRLNVQFTSSTIASPGPPGERRFRSFGLVFVQVFTLDGGNAVENDQLAETAKNAFKGVQLAGNLWFRNTGITTINNQGKWYQQNVSAEFIFDETE